MGFLWVDVDKITVWLLPESLVRWGSAVGLVGRTFGHRGKEGLSVDPQEESWVVVSRL